MLTGLQSIRTLSVMGYGKDQSVLPKPGLRKPKTCQQILVNYKAVGVALHTKEAYAWLRRRAKEHCPGNR